MCVNEVHSSEIARKTTDPFGCVIALIEADQVVRYSGQRAFHRILIIRGSRHHFLGFGESTGLAVDRIDAFFCDFDACSSFFEMGMASELGWPKTACSVEAVASYAGHGAVLSAKAEFVLTGCYSRTQWSSTLST
jgi:hypothetical protein